MMYRSLLLVICSSIKVGIFPVRAENAFAGDGQSSNTNLLLKVIYSKDPRICDAFARAGTFLLRDQIMYYKQNPNDRSSFHLTEPFYRVLVANGIAHPPTVIPDAVQTLPYDFEVAYKVSLEPGIEERVAIVQQGLPPFTNSSHIVFLTETASKSAIEVPNTDWYNQLKYVSADLDPDAGNGEKTSGGQGNAYGVLPLLPAWSRVLDSYAISDIYLCPGKVCAMKFSFPESFDSRKAEAQVVVYVPRPKGRDDICYLDTFSFLYKATAVRLKTQ